MKSKSMWSRRSFVAGASQVGVWQMLAAVPITQQAIPQDGRDRLELLHLACVELACPRPIGDACRRALGVTAPSVSVELLQKLRSAGHDCSSVPAILNSLREQSRRDFTAARIMSVNGWIFSQTETQAYAIADQAT